MEYERRARIAAELARRALEPPEPFQDGPPDALACGLYHQSILWSLKALALQRPVAQSDTDAVANAEPRPEGQGVEADVEPNEPLDEGGASALDQERPHAATEMPVESLELEALWQVARPDQLLTQANLVVEEIAEVRAQVQKSSFETYVDLPTDDQVRWARKLRVVAEGLLYGLEVTSGRYNPPWLARVLRLGLVVALFVGLLWGGYSIKEWVTELDNVSRGKAWSISSTYPAGCRSPAQKCVESPNFFFHTQEQSQPWLEIDLGSVQRFSSVKVVNRKDCCAERAVPLSLEVSSDGKEWRKLARKNEVFGVWHPEFPPVEARWVRLKVLKKSMLHLQSVDVYK